MSFFYIIYNHEILCWLWILEVWKEEWDLIILQLGVQGKVWDGEMSFQSYDITLESIFEYSAWIFDRVSYTDLDAQEILNP